MFYAKGGTSSITGAMARICVILSILCAALGCGNGDAAVQVTGTVKSTDGSPIVGESGSVEFRPTADGKAASAAIEPDGSFEAMTEKQGDGVLPGQYKVTLHIFKNYREQTLAIPERYADVTTTPLEATVDADHAHFDFVVEP